MDSDGSQSAEQVTQPSPQVSATDDALLSDATVTVTKVEPSLDENNKSVCTRRGSI